MAVNPFVNTATLPQVANKIRSSVVHAGQQLLDNYKDIQAQVQANPAYTVDQIVTALGPTDATAVQTYAVLVKSVINTINAGTITDSVPTATIVMPN